MFERDTTLDLAKGFAIILVVVGHALQFSFGAEYTASLLFFEDEMFQAIYSFHMPLFMLISGYLFFNSNKKSFKSVILSKVKGIGIPMVTFTVLCSSATCAKNLVEGEFSHAVRCVVGPILFGYTYWFLYSLLINSILLALLKLLAKSRTTRYVAMLLLFIGSMFIPDTSIRSTFKFMFPFFCIGYVLNENNVDIYRCARNIPLLVSLTLLSALAIGWFDKDTFIYTTGFCITGDYLQQLFINLKRMFIALVVSYTILQYLHLLAAKCKPKLLLTFGQISLFVYGLNIFVDTMYPKAMNAFSLQVPHTIIVPIIFAICILVAAYYLHKLVSNNKLTSILFLGK